MPQIDPIEPIPFRYALIRATPYPYLTVALPRRFHRATSLDMSEPRVEIPPTDVEMTGAESTENPAPAPAQEMQRVSLD